MPVSRLLQNVCRLCGQKTDLSAVQKEPIFFAHVERVGQDTKGNVCPNDLGAVLDKYSRFQAQGVGILCGAEFRQGSLSGAKGRGGHIDIGQPPISPNYYFKTGAEKQTLWFAVFPDQ